jgi:hypothetical protein
VITFQSERSRQCGDLFKYNLSAHPQNSRIFVSGKSEKNSLHIATALVVSFLGQLAVELAALHLTTAPVHRLVRYAASVFLPGAKRASREDRKSETNC